jgi:hypothetical protein
LEAGEGEMKIGEILRIKQPGAYRVLNEKPMMQKERKEHLSFIDYKSMMEEGSVYKRTKGGALRQVRHR